jgi:hypothetical protein
MELTECPGCRGVVVSEGFPVPIHVIGLCKKPPGKRRIMGRIVNVDRERGEITIASPDEEPEWS